MSRDVRFPLGNELFLTVSFYKDRPLIHIRQFKTGPSWRTPGETVLYPTKYGVCLKDDQASQLLHHLPSAISELKRHTYSSLPMATRSDDGFSPTSPVTSALKTDQPEPPTIPMMRSTCNADVVPEPATIPMPSSTPRATFNPDYSNRLQMVYDPDHPWQ